LCQTIFFAVLWCVALSERGVATRAHSIVIQLEGRER
jgi:hypothetical protein